VTSPAAKAGEAAATALAGAALGGLLGLVAPAAVAVPVVAVAAANGAVSGWRGIYEWRSSSGVVAFVLDSTWASATTLSALAAHAVASVSNGGYSPELSRRRNRHVYRAGLRLRKGFAMTLGNVVNGAGDIAKPRRAKLVTDHEDVHVWQARWWGPIYPAVYATWMAGGALVGLVVWATRRRSDPIGKVVESCAYYNNPFEWWAYSRDDHWPPSGKLAELGWKRPAVQAFTATRGRAVPGDRH
jgi:hypothetical protein